jgi:RNA polymerase sigma-70 factor (ECF subfamily)
MPNHQHTTQYKQLSNEDLLWRYKNLDKNAFNEFFRRNSPIIFGFLSSRLRNNSEAEEVLQDTFFRIHKYILKYNCNHNAISWTFTIAKNCMLDRIAQRKKQSEIQNETQAQQKIQEIEAKFRVDAQDQLELLLSELAADDRKLLQDRFLGDTSYDELAKTLDVSAAGVRQRISRIIKKLRDAL